jgi:hypothetical protein
MAYDWRPTGTPAATTTGPRVVVARRRSPTRSPPPSSPPEEARVATVISEFIEAAEDGRARNRSGRRYRPSALRDLSGILRQHVARDLGHMRVRDVRRRHVQALVDRLAADGLSESRIRSVISAVRGLYGYAIEQGYVEVSPATGLLIRGEGAVLEEGQTDSDFGDDPTPDFAWTERPRYDGSPPARTAPPKRDYQPIALLPERILSLVLRIVVVIFILFALFTIVGSASA